MKALGETIGRRIRRAREALGLSVRGLAEQTKGELSHTALAKYESGTMIPGSGALILLARVLGEPVDYFVREFRVNYSRAPKFRVRPDKLSLREQRGIVNRALDFFEAYLEVEDLVDDHIPFDNPLADPRVKTLEDVAARARELREKWKLGEDPLPNVHELMTVKGIKVLEVDTDNPHFDGFHAEVEGQPVVVLASWLNRNLPRKRMTAVHELAHALLEIPEDALEEKLVSRFAGELLLPEESFKKMWGRARTAISMAELQELKAFFGASIMSIIYRAGQFKLLDEKACTDFWTWVDGESGWREKGEPGDDQFRGTESNHRFRQLVFRAVMEEKLTLSRAAALLKCDPARLRGEMANVFG